VSEARGNSGQPRAGLRVLVIDGNRDAADALGLLVRRWGHESQQAYSAAARTAARASRPQIIFAEPVWPGGSGYFFSRW
jgi:hypothetical protein